MRDDISFFPTVAARAGSLECPSAARNLRPMTDEEVAGNARFGDLIRYAPAIQKLTAS